MQLIIRIFIFLFFFFVQYCPEISISNSIFKHVDNQHSFPATNPKCLRCWQIWLASRVKSGDRPFVRCPPFRFTTDDHRAPSTYFPMRLKKKKRKKKKERRHAKTSRRENTGNAAFAKMPMYDGALSSFNPLRTRTTPTPLFFSTNSRRVRDFARIQQFLHASFQPRTRFDIIVSPKVWTCN